MKRGLIVVIAVAALLRIFIIFAVSPTLEGDTDSYVREAKAIVTGVSLDANPNLRRRPPGYPYFLAAIYSLSMDNNFLVVLAQHLMGFAAVLMIIFLGGFLQGERGAALAALLVTTDLYILFYEHAVLSDFLQMFLLTAGVFALGLNARNGKSGGLLAAGVAHGLLALTKTVYYAYFIVPLAALLLLNRGAGWKKRAGGMAAYAGPFFALLIGWNVWTAATNIGTGAASDLGRNLMIQAEHFIDYDSPKHAELKRMFKEHEPFRVENGGKYAFVEMLVFKKYREKHGLSMKELDKIYVDVALEAMRSHPDKFLGRFFRNLYLLYFPKTESGMESLEYLDADAVGGRPGKVMMVKNIYRQMNKALVALFFVGLVLCPAMETDSRRRAVYILFAVTVCYVSVLSCLLSGGLIRYRVVVEPLIMLFAAAGVVAVAARMRKKEAK